MPGSYGKPLAPPAHESDGITPDRASGFITEHARTFVEQFLLEISALRPEHRAFLIGATNHFNDIDPAIRNGDRFSEHLTIPLPGQRVVAGS